ncbi:MAG: hypothetical protein IJO71_09280 [Microbacterium sp.]|uniref:hypothetical protein n=1 Tax=Microbacterium sp. TaxID=51671 RepID=UPI0025EF618E|nr:hypothetical protein [Microbacterium sp.]MBQ9917373.1 hypothetical protein [Microbacterium sp.]
MSDSSIHDAAERRAIAAAEVAGVAPRRPRFGWCVVVAAVAVLALPSTVWTGVAAVRAPHALPACVTEDDVTDCYWDAQTRGNGRGLSFEVRGGVVYYADGTCEVIPVGARAEGVR